MPDARELYANYHPVLSIVGRDGSGLKTRPIAPWGEVGRPQWTPDSHNILLSMLPYGRRIVVVQAEPDIIADLTQPRWDPYFALSADGKYLLLDNGRGGFWRADIR